MQEKNTAVKRTTRKGRPANRKEKKVLREIAAKLPEIIIPISIGEFKESEENPGLMIPIVEYGRIVESGHLSNLKEAFRESREAGVAEYVKSVYDRSDKNKSQFNDTANTNGAKVLKLKGPDSNRKAD